MVKKNDNPNVAKLKQCPGLLHVWEFCRKPRQKTIKKINGNAIRYTDEHGDKICSGYKGCFQCPERIRYQYIG